tara:strand:+ start:1515 stop:2522 length:1008 start_codon:yes stop_codon:yes gene_type:complete
MAVNSMSISPSCLKLTETILGISHISTYEFLAQDSRHLLWKIQHRGKSFLIKTFRQEQDPYFDHRFRREERLLNFLQQQCPELSPNIYGGALIEQQEALVVMEYINGTALHAALESSGPTECNDYIKEAVESQVRLHHTFDNYSGLMRNIANSCILDRNNLTTLTARFRLACKRISGNTVTNETSSQFKEHVFKPLLLQPHHPIHNSLSPLNMVLKDDSSAIVIDFETLSVGPRVLDLAELAAFPSSTNYSTNDIHQIYSEQCDEIVVSNLQSLQLAIITRALDGAGSIKHQVDRDSNVTSHYDERIEGYLSNALTASVSAKLPKPIIDYLESLL